MNGAINDAPGVVVAIPSNVSGESLEVANGGSGGSGDELLTVSETRLKDREHDIPVTIHPSVLGGRIGHLVVECNVLTSLVLEIVDDRVTGPAGHGILRVVSITDSKHAKDGAGLHNGEAIFLPHGHGAERSCWLECWPIREFNAIVLILNFSDTKKQADSFSTCAKVEIGKLGL